MTTRYLAGRLGALTAAALTALLVTALPAAAEVTGKYVGTVEGGQGHGFKMKQGDNVGGVYASLLGIDLDGDDVADLETYCVEIDINARGGAQMVEAPWSEYPGGSGDLANPEKVLWILHNSYPNVGLDELADKLGVDEIDSKDAISGTQAAIWHYSNDAELAEDAGNIRKLYDYLTGEANTGIGEQPPASLSITPEEIADVTAGSKAGPFTIETNATTVTLTVDGPDGVEIVDEAGEALVGAVDAGTPFYLSSPSGESLGPATVRATAEASVEKGRLFVGASDQSAHSESRTQTLIVATSEKGEAKAEAVARWVAGAAPTTTTTVAPTTTTESERTTAPEETTSVAPTTTTPPVQGGPLPNTGASVMTAIGVGVVLLAVGVGLVLLQRRRGAGDGADG